MVKQVVNNINPEISGAVVICIIGILGIILSYIVGKIIDVLKKELIAGGSIHIKGFGAFKTVEHQARKGVNPATGEKIVIPKRKVAVFKVSKGFMNAINEKK